ncbi:GlxA family transcriptional regulator [Litoribrevibacter euphylliae]|uniref:GlxA family transcriptional regulator n=1 Tax=Litoribrevibacter euphylliae TaxID=1834034 RepID=A0ABV7HCM8_9GAMM
MKKVFILLYDGVQLMDCSGPSEVLSCANLFSKESLYEIIYVTPNLSGEVHTSSNLTLKATPLFIPEKLDLLIIPGAKPSIVETTMESKSLIDWISEISKIAKVKASIGTGAFFLGETGLLNKRKVTTHWMGVDSFKERYPETHVKEGILYLHDGDVWSSAGMSSGVDMLLAMVMKDYGKEFAILIARKMVIYLLRRGGQAQFSMPIDFQSKSKDESLIPLISWLETRLDNPPTVEEMAKFSLSSVRTLHRNCISAFKMSPAQLLSELRLQRGKILLQDETLSVKQVAAQVGFNQSSTFSRAFNQRFGVSPRVYREPFLFIHMSQPEKESA